MYITFKIYISTYTISLQTSYDNKIRGKQVNIYHNLINEHFFKPAFSSILNNI